MYFQLSYNEKTKKKNVTFLHYLKSLSLTGFLQQFKKEKQFYKNNFKHFSFSTFHLLCVHYFSFSLWFKNKSHNYAVNDINSELKFSIFFLYVQKRENLFNFNFLFFLFHPKLYRNIKKKCKWFVIAKENERKSLEPIMILLGIAKIHFSAEPFEKQTKQKKNSTRFSKILLIAI